MTTYKPGEVAALLDIKDNTLRKWSSDQEFGQYLSSRAQGGGGSHRAYTEHDVRILTLIAEMKQQNSTLEDIHASLKSLRSAGWAGLPDMPATPPGMEPVSMIPREAAESKIDQQRQSLMREISQLQERLDLLIDELEAERADRRKVETELSETKAKLARAEGQLEKLPTLEADHTRLQRELIDRERQTTTFWLRIIAVVIVIAVMVTVILLLLAKG